MKMPVLLIVDDEKPTRDALRMGFQDDYEVYTAANLSQASALLQEESPDLVLTDLRLGGESGMDVLKAAASLPHPPQSIMMTAYGSVDAAVAAMKEGAYDFVTKPLNLDAVELVLKRALHTRNLETANQELTTRIQADSGLQKLLGRSAAMEHVFSIIRQVAPSKTTVLIEGESGTGKELVAQAIHSLSGRPENKFVAVNCAALSPQLLESELFGLLRSMVKYIHKGFYDPVKRIYIIVIHNNVVNFINCVKNIYVFLFPDFRIRHSNKGKC